MNSVSIRPAVLEDSLQLAQILVKTNADTFRGLVPDKCLTSPTIKESESNWRRFFRSGCLGKNEILLAATKEDDNLVGYALAGRQSRYPGYPRELSVLMVLPRWQRRGIGRDLVSHISHELYQQGLRTMLVGILIENPNQAFYEKLGARQVGARPYTWAGYKTRELLYGWDNLASLFDLET
jgi:ribosomal protein S18 acetylase RimI-like enzyme